MTVGDITGALPTLSVTRLPRKAKRGDRYLIQARLFPGDKLDQSSIDTCGLPQLYDPSSKHCLGVVQVKTVNESPGPRLRLTHLRNEQKGISGRDI